MLNWNGNLVYSIPRHFYNHEMSKGSIAQLERTLRTGHLSRLIAHGIAGWTLVSSSFKVYNAGLTFFSLSFLLLCLSFVSSEGLPSSGRVHSSDPRHCLCAAWCWWQGSGSVCGVCSLHGRMNGRGQSSPEAQRGLGNHQKKTLLWWWRRRRMRRASFLLTAALFPSELLSS